MLSDIPLKICIITSVFIHTTLLYPWPILRSLSRHEISFQKIELTYFHDKAIDDVILRDINPITSMSGAAGAKVAELKKVQIEPAKKSVQQVKPKKEKADKSITKALSETPSKAEDDSVKGLSESDSLRLDYCMRVREKIKSMIEKNKKKLVKGGEVYVRFAISNDGTLQDMALYKSFGKGTKRLEALAIKSIKEAAPFPPFSDDMSDTKLLFKLPISYRP